MSDQSSTEEIAFEARVRIPASVQLQELEGESIILNLQTDLYLGLNQSGTQLLDQLTRFDTVEEAYEALLRQYDIEPEKLRSELAEFLGTLLEHKLIELDKP